MGDVGSALDVADTEVHEDLLDLESFWYVANDTFEKKTSKDHYEFISEDFQFGEDNYPAMDLDWEEENPDSTKALCPRLFERFGVTGGA